MSSVLCLIATSVVQPYLLPACAWVSSLSPAVISGFALTFYLALRLLAAAKISLMHTYTFAIWSVL